MKKLELIYWDFNEVLPTELGAYKGKSLYVDNEKQFGLMSPEVLHFNLNELVWAKEIGVSDKLNKIAELRGRLKYGESNFKPLKFDIYYPFATDLATKSLNQQIKQLDLAAKVVKIVKRWDRKYMVDLNKKMNGRVLVDFFKLGLTQHRLTELGFNYRHPETTVKTLINWAGDMVKDQIITNEQYNDFLEELENICCKSE